MDPGRRVRGLSWVPLAGEAQKPTMEYGRIIRFAVSCISFMVPCDVDALCAIRTWSMIVRMFTLFAQRVSRLSSFHLMPNWSTSLFRATVSRLRSIQQPQSVLAVPLNCFLNLFNIAPAVNIRSDGHGSWRIVLSGIFFQKGTPNHLDKSSGESHRFLRDGVGTSVAMLCS